MLGSNASHVSLGVVYESPSQWPKIGLQWTVITDRLPIAPTARDADGATGARATREAKTE